MMAKLFSRQKLRHLAINCNLFIFILSSEKKEKNYLILAELHYFERECSITEDKEYSMG